MRDQDEETAASGRGGGAATAAIRTEIAAEGFVRFAPEPSLVAWADALAPFVRERLADPAAAWRHAGASNPNGTWHPGVGLLETDGAGAWTARGVGPLEGRAVAAAQALWRELAPAAAFAFDRGQLSIVRSGYPDVDAAAGESEAAHRYRLRRDAAHVDGLLRGRPEDLPPRRRFVGERHAFLLGVGLDDAAPGASPLVLWRGSHHVMRRALVERLAARAPADWAEEDIADAYAAARRVCFETCERIEAPAVRGGAVLVHRLTLHGVAPWTAAASQPPRAVAYFRPEPAGGFAQTDVWLSAP